MTVRGKTLPLAQEAAGAASGSELEAIALAPGVVHVPHVGFVCVREGQRDFISLASLRAALNATRIDAFADDASVHAAIDEPAPLGEPQDLVGRRIEPFEFEDLRPTPNVEGLAFASHGDFSWRLVNGDRVVEMSTRPTESLPLDVSSLRPRSWSPS